VFLPAHTGPPAAIRSCRAGRARPDALRHRRARTADEAAEHVAAGRPHGRDGAGGRPGVRRGLRADHRAGRRIGTLLRGAEFGPGVRGADARMSTSAGSASSRRRSGTTWTRSSTGSPPRSTKVEERMTSTSSCATTATSCMWTGRSTRRPRSRSRARERMIDVVTEVDGRRSRGSAGTEWSARPRPGRRVVRLLGGRACGVAGGRGSADWCRSARTRSSPARWVTSPRSVLAVEVQPRNPARRAVWRRAADGGGHCRPARGSRVRRGAVPVRLARLHHASFTDRLVAKFACRWPGLRGAPH